MSTHTPVCGHCGIDICGAHVIDDETGTLFCGGICHHRHYSAGGLLPLTHPEERSLERAQRGEKEHRAP